LAFGTVITFAHEELAMLALAWKNEISVGDLLAVAGFLLTLAGLLFAGWQFRRQALIERGRFLVERADRLLAEEGVGGIITALVRGEFQFNRNHPPSQAVQDNLDTLLDRFNLIGRLLQMGILTREDANFFAAEGQLVLRNRHVQAYIEWVNEDHAPPGGWWPGAAYLGHHLPGERAIHH
jgi:hypothetical protein